MEASSSPKGGDISSGLIAVDVVCGGKVLGVVVRAVLGDARSKTWQMLVAGFVVRSAKVPGGGEAVGNARSRT